MHTASFYAEGLAFTCTRCSACCRFDPGFVFLSERDAAALAQAVGMRYSEFLDAYCRWIPAGDGTEQLSLKEKSNYDCVFWDGGCTVYGSRPLQCRTFPFWDSVLASPEAWAAAGRDCPGIGKGACHDAEEIEGLLAAREEDPVLSRKRR